MERIVYFLGAGFSAPLGLPVMKNFLVKSKDMYFSNPSKWQYFHEIFQTISEMSFAKNYYNMDLFNIEEILSVLEMQDHLTEQERSDRFRRYIADVIQFFTPPMPPNRDDPGNWEDHMFGGGYDGRWRMYATFIANILNLEVSASDSSINPSLQNLKFTSSTDPAALYSIVTVNYDQIPETVVDFIQSNFPDSDGVSFSTTTTDNNKPASLAKLHGSIEPMTLTLPTWNKGNNHDVLEAWQIAGKLIREATQIRILGYSLPENDAYVRYLFKASTLDAPHLKQIDVLCQDPYGDVKNRFDNFIELKSGYYRFKNIDIHNYLRELDQFRREHRRERKGLPIKFDFLETCHNFIM